MWQTHLRAMSATPPRIHVLAKPTGAICNLDCSYCFFLEKERLYPDSGFRMSDELLERYIQQLIEQVRSGACREISASREAMARYDEDRVRAAKDTIWASGCKSWYLDANGVPTAWPWTFDRFREQMSAPRLEDFAKS